MANTTFNEAKEKLAILVAEQFPMPAEWKLADQNIPAQLYLYQFSRYKGDKENRHFLDIPHGNADGSQQRLKFQSDLKNTKYNIAPEGSWQRYEAHNGNQLEVLITGNKTLTKTIRTDGAVFYDGFIDGKLVFNAEISGNADSPYQAVNGNAVDFSDMNSAGFLEAIRAQQAEHVKLDGSAPAVTPLLAPQAAPVAEAAADAAPGTAMASQADTSQAPLVAVTPPEAPEILAEDAIADTAQEALIALRGMAAAKKFEPYILDEKRKAGVSVAAFLKTSTDDAEKIEGYLTTLGFEFKRDNKEDEPIIEVQNAGRARELFKALGFTFPDIQEARVAKSEESSIVGFVNPSILMMGSALAEKAMLSPKGRKLAGAELNTSQKWDETLVKKDWKEAPSLEALGNTAREGLYKMSDMAAGTCFPMAIASVGLFAMSAPVIASVAAVVAAGSFLVKAARTAVEANTQIVVAEGKSEVIGLSRALDNNFSKTSAVVKTIGKHIDKAPYVAACTTLAAGLIGSLSSSAGAGATTAFASGLAPFVVAAIPYIAVPAAILTVVGGAVGVGIYSLRQMGKEFEKLKPTPEAGKSK